MHPISRNLKHFRHVAYPLRRKHLNYTKSRMSISCCCNAELSSDSYVPPTLLRRGLELRPDTVIEPATLIEPAEYSMPSLRDDAGCYSKQAVVMQFHCGLSGERATISFPSSSGVMFGRPCGSGLFTVSSLRGILRVRWWRGARRCAACIHIHLGHWRVCTGFGAWCGRCRPAGLLCALSSEVRLGILWQVVLVHLARIPAAVAAQAGAAVRVGAVSPC